MDARTQALLDVIKTLPQHTLEATIRNPRSQADRTFKGALLSDYAIATGLIPEKNGGGKLATGYFVATAEDGMRVAVALAEAMPSATPKTVLLAYEQDGEPLGVGVRLVVPDYPGLAGRSITGVVSVELRDTLTGSPRAESEASTHISLSGLLERPGLLDTSAFTDPVEVTTVAASGHGGAPIEPRTYSGVPLFRLLEQAGMHLDAAVNEDVLQKVVVATSADGHPVVIACGEIEPRFMAGQVIVATHRDGVPLGPEEGPARLVVPYDRKPGRWARNLVSFDFREA